MGSASDSCAASYTLSGGTYSVNGGNNFILGAGTQGINQTVFTMSGSGKLIVSGQIYGSQGTGAQQLFNFNGGTLVAGSITMGNLATTASPTVTGTLYNNGGIVAPGDIGIPGKTTINGAYTVTSPSAALDIDIAGPYPPSSFQMVGGQNYDQLAITGNATVAGALNLGLINGYVPASGASMTVLSAGSPIAGSFSNVPNGSLLKMGSTYLGVYYGVGLAAPNSVTVSTLVGSNAVAWNNTTGGTWGTNSNWAGGTAPNGAGSAAFLSGALTSAGTVAMPSNETVGVLAFLNSTASYTVGSGLTGGTLTLNGNGVASQINDLSGTHVITAPITVAGNNNLNVTVQNPTDSLALNGGVSGLSGTLQVLGAGTLSIYQPAGSPITIGTVNGQPGSTVVLGGDPGNVNTITNPLNAPGQTVVFNGGNWNLVNGGGVGGGVYASTLEVSAGSVTRPPSTGDFHGLQGLIITGGTLADLTQYGLRMGSTGGAGDTTNGTNFVGVQTGGVLYFSNSGTGGSNVEFGSATPNVNASYSLTGGTFIVSNSSANNLYFNIGAATTGTGTTTFTLGGTGKLVYMQASAGIQGNQGGTARQIFNFNGGTLVASNFYATNLSSPAAPTVQGTLVNSGGTVAPGDIGTPGRTTLGGNYSVTSANAALDIDIGGPTQASAFQNPGAYYDFLSVSGSATVGGVLNVGLINSYQPATGANFTVLQAGSPVTGSFSNMRSGSVLAMGGDYFSVYYGAGAASPNNVTVLTLVGSNSVAWNNSTGGPWGTNSNWAGGTAPNAAGASAYFGGALLPSGGIVAMPVSQTVGVLSFANTNASYSIGSGLTGGTLTLNNNGATAQIYDLGGTHVITAPITLAGNTNLNVLVYNPTDSVALNGGVSGLSGTLQVLGAGTVSLYQPAGSSTTIGTVNGQVGSTVVLGGDPGNVNTISNALNTAGQTVKFNGGTWNLNAGGNYASTIEVDSGLVSRPPSTGDFNFLQGLTITGGTLQDLTQYGLRMGGNGAGSTGGVPFVGVQTGGVLVFSNSNTGGSQIEFGSNSPNVNASYSLTGGTFMVAPIAGNAASNNLNLNIGAATTGTGSTTFTLGGTGKLLFMENGGAIQGIQATGAQQIFNFNGGTLVVSNLYATCLASPSAPTVQGTLVNSGGTVAPGDIGTPGRTVLGGNYNVTSANAALAIDIGGPTQASAFQNPGAYYDFLSVSGSATVGGALNVGLVNSYLPATGTNFQVLYSGSTIGGSFTNQANGSMLTMSGELFGVYYGSGASAAGYATNYVTVATLVGSNASIWSNTTGDTWGTSSNWNATGVPNGTGAVTFFGNALTASGTVAMPSSETVGILSFLNTAASYTVGSGTAGGYLLLNNGVSTNNQINDFGGSHTVNATIQVMGNNNLNVTVSNAPDTLTLSGGVFGSGTILYSGAGNLTMTNGVWPIGAITDNAVGTLTISGSLGASGAVQNSGSGNMSISGGASMASLTNSSTGYVTISGGAVVTGVVTNNASAGNLAFPGGLTAVTLTNNSTSGTVTVYQAAGSSGTIGTVNATSGATVVLGGDPTSTTAINNGGALNTLGANVKFNGGTWNLNYGGGYQSNLEVDSGNVTVNGTPGGSQDFNSIVSLTIKGGTLTAADWYGMRMGSAGGANANNGVNFVGVQTGGLVSVLANPSNNYGSNSAQLGSATPNDNASYTLSGGTFSVPQSSLNLALILGAATSGSGTTTFTLAGSGELLTSGNIYGIQGAGAQQVFDFHGGTLVANTIDATNLSGTAAPAVHGTLYNTGGTMAPGGIGTAGRTALTGNYVQSGGALAIDIGGTTQANGFQTGQYDYLSVTGSATLGGALNLGLIGGYVPATGTNFTVLASGPLSGSFSNLPSGSVVATPGNTALLAVYYGSGAPAGYNANTVTVTTLAGSDANIWNNSAAGSWGTGSNWSTSSAPSAPSSIAFFGPALTTSGIVPLAGPTTVGVLSFLNTAAGYTVGPGTGSYTLTLNNGASDAQINDFGGAHGVSAPIVVVGDNKLDVVVTNASDSLTLSGAISVSGTLNKSGAGALILAGNNTYSGATVLNAGTLVLASSSAGSVNSAFTDNVNGGLQFGSGVTAAAFGSLTGAGNINLTSSNGLAVNLTVDGNGVPTTYSGAISGSGSLTKAGSGVMLLTLSSVLSQSGGLTVSNGTVQAWSAQSMGPLVINQGAMFQAMQGDVLGNTTGWRSTNGITIDEGTLTVVAANRLSMDRNVTMSGGTIASADAGDGAGCAYTFRNAYGAVYTFTSASDGAPAVLSSIAVGMQGNTVFNVNPGGGPVDLNVTGTLVNCYFTGGVIKNGNGVMVISSTNDAFNGPTTINGGILGIAGDGSLGVSTPAITTQALTFGGNSTLQAEAAGIVLSSSRTVTINSGVTATIDTHGNNMTISGQISGAGKLTKVGAGTLTLANSTNNFNGGVSLNAGVLDFVSNALNNNAVNFSGGTLQWAGGNSQDVSSEINIANSNQTAYLDTTTNTVTFNTAIGGSGGLTKLGAGTLILNDSNSYGGGTDVEGGTLQVMNSNSLNYDTGLTVGTNGTVDIGAPTGAAAAFVARSVPAASAAGAVAAVPERAPWRCWPWEPWQPRWAPGGGGKVASTE